MTLNPYPHHPSDRTYVLKLHREAGTPPGCLRGRLESIATGRWVEFSDADELLTHLTRGTLTAPEPPSAADHE